MAGLADLLGNLIGSQAGAQAPGVDPGQSVSNQSQGSTPLSELLVQPKGGTPSGPMVNGPPATIPGPMQMQGAPQSAPLADPMGSLVGQQDPQGATLNYNNSPSVAAVNAQDQANQPTQVNSGNPGLYGILPQNLQHGVLRNTLGAIGDAFLVAGNKAPSYANSLASEAIGNAMAGVDYTDPKSVAAAMQRVGATGAPGAIQTMDAVQKNYNDVQLRQAEQANLNQWRTGNLYEKNQNLIRQAAPQMQNYLAQATSKADYAQRLQYIKSRMQAIDPSLNAEAELNVPGADQWTPDLMKNIGVTGGQQLTSTTSTNNNIRSTTQSGQNAQTAANAKVASAKIMAGGRQPSAAGFDESLVGAFRQAQSSGQPMDAGTAVAFDKRFGTATNPHPSQSAIPRSPYAGQPTPTGPAAAEGNQVGNALATGIRQPQQFQNGHVYTDAHGNHATYMNGKFIPHR